MLKDGEGILTISKYEQKLADHSRHIMNLVKHRPPLVQIEELVQEFVMH